MPFGLGVWDLVIVLVVLAVIFGPKKLPEVARSLGKGMREVREPLESAKSTIGLDDVKQTFSLDPPKELPPAQEADPAEAQKPDP